MVGSVEEGPEIDASEVELTVAAKWVLSNRLPAVQRVNVFSLPPHYLCLENQDV